MKPVSRMISHHENLVKFAECGRADAYKPKDLKLVLKGDENVPCQEAIEMSPC